MIDSKIKDLLARSDIDDENSNEIPLEPISQHFVMSTNESRKHGEKLHSRNIQKPMTHQVAKRRQVGYQMPAHLSDFGMRGMHMPSCVIKPSDATDHSGVFVRNPSLHKKKVSVAEQLRKVHLPKE